MVCVSSLLSAQPLSTLQSTPGYVDPEDSESCFSYMGPVEFSPAYKWITSYTGTPAIPSSDWSGGLLNDPSRRLYGFSIPLVGDLNGDGYPEIVAMGLVDNSSGFSSTSTYIYIYDGRTGKELSRFTLPATWNNRASGFHGSPSHLALIDIDPTDGTKEIIVAFGYTGDSYSHKVACYSVNDKFELGDGTVFGTNGATVSPRWISTVAYNAPLAAGAGNYSKPIPQVVDLDGDGIPEVVVYNKIYNARTGALLCTLETLKILTSTDSDRAFVGRDLNARVGDNQMNFSYIYDIDGDGIYDIIAGGKVYKLSKNTDGSFSYTTIELAGLGDGMTGVADINCDGTPDIVVAQRVSSTVGTKVTVYNIDPNTNTSFKIAECTIPFRDGSTNEGSSYLYIGDIDGKVNNGKRYPEIAILSGRLNAATASAMLHPNFSSSQFPSTGYIPSTSSTNGTLVGVTFDETVASNTGNLKISFVLGHNDSSANTGFTMFDFDNDGIQEICYRDEQTLRIIKGNQSYVKADETVKSPSNPNSPILFQKTVHSYTGFEYPVIADVDNDASAEMIVMGFNESNTVNDYSFLYNVGSNGDKFSPALGVWNQFMYDPFKINPDLTTPKGAAHAPNRLSSDYVYKKVIRGEDGLVLETIDNYNPYNATLNQIFKFQMSNDGYEPIVFLADAYLVGASNTTPTKNPKIVTSGATSKIEIYAGNRATAGTSVSSATQITLYKTSISADNYYKTYSLGQLGFNSSIAPGDEIKLEIPIDDPYAYYVIRFGDSSDFTDPSAPIWRWGENNPGINDLDYMIGTATRANRDCNWDDQIAYASLFQITDYIATIQEYTSLTIDILANVVLQDPSTSTFSDLQILTPPKAGTVQITGTGTGTKLVYAHTSKPKLTESVDEFEISITYNLSTGTVTRTSKIYIFVLQNQEEGFATCFGDNLTIKLVNPLDDIDFYWYQVDGTTPVGTNPQSTHTIAGIATEVKFMVKPDFKTKLPYKNIIFPQGLLTVQPVGTSLNELVALKWTGAINTEWDNPANWVDLSDNPVTYAPVSCVDVTIPKVTTNYPVVSQESEANVINLFDRSMIKNIHALTSSSVTWEFAPKSAEMDKWLSLVAPLSNMYAGDYILLDNTGEQITEATYISFFQATDPDLGTASGDNNLTRPFGKIEEELNLNKPFFLYIDGNYNTSIGGGTSKYQIPTGKTTLTYNYNTVVGGASRQSNSGTLVRATGNKEQFSIFADGTLDVTTGEFSIPYSGGSVLYVANPFPAMMNVEAFVLANSDVLTTDFKIWDGTLGNFVEKRAGNGTQLSGFQIKSGATFNTATATGITLVAPFQGFFVKLKSGTSATLKFRSVDTSVDAVDYTY